MSPKKIPKPWGYYEVIHEGQGYLIKIITVYSGQRLSVQRHQHRKEIWQKLSGVGHIIIDDADIRLVRSFIPGETYFIERMKIHSAINVGTVDLVFLEIQIGDILDENDIEQVEDFYHRI